MICAVNLFAFHFGSTLLLLDLDSAEFLDVSSRKWQSLPRMAHKRSWAAAASLDGCVYVTGGSGSPTSPPSVECFNPTTKRWTRVRDMNVE